MGNRISRVMCVNYDVRPPAINVDNNTTGESVTRIQCFEAQVTNTTETDLDSMRYDFNHRFDRTRKDTPTENNQTEEIFAVGEAEFRLKIDLKEGNAFQTIAVETFISSKSNNVTLFNGQILITDCSSKQILYKVFNNTQHFMNPTEEKILETALLPIHEKWLQGYIGELSFSFTGSLLISPGPLKINQVEQLKMKLEESPQIESKMDLFFDAANKPDLTIKVANSEKEFSAHKVILTERCKVFEDMFNSNTVENELNSIQIDDLDEDVFEALLFYIYSGHSPHISSMPRELLQAADKYGLENLKLLAEIELTKITDFNNVCELSNVAHTCNAKSLLEFTVKFVTDNFHAVTSGGRYDKLHDMPEDALDQVMKNNEH